MVERQRTNPNMEPQVTDRPYVLLSCAMSVDGYIDDNGPERLLLSNDEDFDRVDGERAECDAILVGANTIRRDNPTLRVRSDVRRATRVARGLPEHPTRVTLTSNGDLDPKARFFSTGVGDRVVYAATPAVAHTRATLAPADGTVVVDAGDPLDLSRSLADLARRGVRRLMVEGGGATHTAFLAAGLVDEVHLAVAPFFVGDPTAPRFTTGGVFPYGPTRPMRLAETRPIGDVVLLRYVLDPD